MIYGYARVSTKGQAKDGNSLEAQEKLLRENGASVIYHDAFTGTKVDRPELNKLVELLKSGDILVVSKLDRLGRSLSKTSELITKLLERGVTINILNLGVLSNNSVNTLMRNVLLAFAQFERDMIVERTSEGKAIAREREDYREGRPPKEIPDFEIFLKKQKDGLMTVDECCKALGIGRSTWYARAREVIV
jgi:DNA invertase Pin-like site-specific DNA recombinase